MPSFTTHVPDLHQIGPVIEIGIDISSFLEDLIRNENLPVPNALQTVAIIDTGTTGTVIPQDLIDRHSLKKQSEKISS